MKIQRKKTNIVKIGDIKIGGLNPIVIQSMTSTDTADIQATTSQIIKLYNAGSQMIRITVNNDDSAKAVVKIKEKLLQKNINVPLIGDFHFNGDRLLKRHLGCAESLNKYRINPGNIKDNQFLNLIELAIKHNKAIRIGVNWGSLDQSLLAKMLDKNNQKKQSLPLDVINKQAVIESAISSAKLAEKIGLSKNKIILSCKMSAVQDLIDVYRDLNRSCNYALHLGLTEAGLGNKGIVSSVAALSILLQQGIGDTIRISITPIGQQKRDEEVKIARQLLQSMQINFFKPEIIACPGCGRTSSDSFIKLAQASENFINKNYHKWQHKKNINNIKIAVMGCVVNGPGESKYADIGISLPGSGEDMVAPIYINGKKSMTVKGENMADDFLKILKKYLDGLE
ncbi:MAG: 4-hydroxy-3-methylbut-2-en-1-yl diphosphate synthase [Gammaproteobacteria bacterium]|nr:MAG: 4-hydroxy-3-methylbut-2-en-1-yl diphosphate synthase [Gammaproteobacteria bacterium]